MFRTETRLLCRHIIGSVLISSIHGYLLNCVININLKLQTASFFTHKYTVDMTQIVCSNHGDSTLLNLRLSCSEFKPSISWHRLSLSPYTCLWILSEREIISLVQLVDITKLFTSKMYYYVWNMQHLYIDLLLKFRPADLHFWDQQITRSTFQQATFSLCLRIRRGAADILNERL
jgi:hypothetical protein